MTHDRSGAVTLRDPVATDAEIHVSYFPPAEFVRMYGGDSESIQQPELATSHRWVEWLKQQPYGKIIEADGAAVGHLRLHTLSNSDHKARLAIGMFATDFVGKGIGRKAIMLALDHAFGEMRLHRIDLRVLAYNERAIRCYRACGFRHEGTEREAAFVDGKWHDDWIMGVLAHEHEFHRSEQI